MSPSSVLIINGHKLRLPREHGLGLGLGKIWQFSIKLQIYKSDIRLPAVSYLTGMQPCWVFNCLDFWPEYIAIEFQFNTQFVVWTYRHRVHSLSMLHYSMKITSLLEKASAKLKTGKSSSSQRSQQLPKSQMNQRRWSSKPVSETNSCRGMETKHTHRGLRLQKSTHSRPN